MATATKKCKVCGIDYEYCHTNRRVAGVFRWQDVACCPEHGSIYLARIEASRSGSTSNNKVAAKDAEVVNEPITSFNDLDECDGEDDWFERDFDDEEAEETVIYN